MRKLTLLALPLLAVPALAQAQPKKCAAPVDGVPSLDCLRDDVLVLDGTKTAQGVAGIEPLVISDKAANPPAPAMGMPATPPMIVPCTDAADCIVNYPAAVSYAVGLVGPGDNKRWDQFVVFGQMMAPATNAPGPLFYRDGYRATLDGGANDVDRIGLTVKARTRPMVGYIAAGGTTQIGAANNTPIPWNPVAGAFAPCGRAPRRDTDPQAAQPAKALCFPTLYNYFDALAQATGS